MRALQPGEIGTINEKRYAVCRSTKVVVTPAGRGIKSTHTRDGKTCTHTPSLYVLRARYAPLDGAPMRQVQASGSTLSDAKSAWDVKIAKALTPPVDASTITIAQIGDRLFPDPRTTPRMSGPSQRVHRPRTRMKHHYDYVRWIRPAWGEKRLAGVRRRDLERWLTGQLEHYAATTVSGMQALLAKIFDAAEIDGIIDVSPMTGVKAWKRSIARKGPVQAPDREAALAWASWLSQHPYARKHSLDLIVAVTLEMGTRHGETLALRWDKDLVVEDDGHISVLVQGTRNLDVYGRVVIADVKNSVHRRLHLGPDLSARLLEHRVSKRDLPGNLLFASRTGALMDPSAVNRRLRGLHQEFVAENPEFGHITIQALRRTAATHLARTQGVSTASKALGHRLESTTVGSYIAPTLEDVYLS